jgi:hypothetical protein
VPANLACSISRNVVRNVVKTPLEKSWTASQQSQTGLDRFSMRKLGRQSYGWGALCVPCNSKANSKHDPQRAVEAERTCHRVTDARKCGHKTITGIATLDRIGEFLEQGAEYLVVRPGDFLNITLIAEESTMSVNIITISRLVSVFDVVMVSGAANHS